MDYLFKNKMKPKVWWEQPYSREDKNKYFELFNSKYNIDLQTFYNYSILDKINDKISLFVYKNNSIKHYEL